jgi:hypothetical protein
MRVLSEPAPSRMVSVPRVDLAEWARQVEAAAQLLDGTTGEALREVASQIALRAAPRRRLI